MEKNETNICNNKKYFFIIALFIFYVYSIIFSAYFKAEKHIITHIMPETLFGFLVFPIGIHIYLGFVLLPEIILLKFLFKKVKKIEHRIILTSLLLPLSLIFFVTFEPLKLGVFRVFPLFAAMFLCDILPYYLILFLIMPKKIFSIKWHLAAAIFFIMLFWYPLLIFLGWGDM